jgi:hypothetical protein
MVYPFKLIAYIRNASLTPPHKIFPLSYLLSPSHASYRFSIDLIEQGYTDHLKTYCDYIPSLTQSDRNLWTVVGEFTTASTDCEFLMDEVRVGTY